MAQQNSQAVSVVLKLLDEVTQPAKQVSQAIDAINKILTGTNSAAKAASAGMSLFGTAMSGINSAVGALQSRMSGFIAGFGLISIWQRSIDAAKHHAESMQSLNIAMEGEKNHIDDIVKSAKEWQDKTIFNRDEIIRSSAMLRQEGVALTKLNDVMKVSMDLTSAMGGNLEGRARQMGMFLQTGYLTRELRHLIPELMNFKQGDNPEFAFQKIQQRFAGASEKKAATPFGINEQERNKQLEVYTELGDQFIKLSNVVIPAITLALKDLNKNLQSPNGQLFLELLIKIAQYFVRNTVSIVTFIAVTKGLKVLIPILEAISMLVVGLAGGGALGGGGMAGITKMLTGPLSQGAIMGLGAALFYVSQRLQIVAERAVGVNSEFDTVGKRLAAIASIGTKDNPTWGNVGDGFSDLMSDAFSGGEGEAATIRAKAGNRKINADQNTDWVDKATKSFEDFKRILADIRKIEKEGTPYDEGAINKEHLESEKWLYGQRLISLREYISTKEAIDKGALEKNIQNLKISNEKTIEHMAEDRKSIEKWIAQGANITPENAQRLTGTLNYFNKDAETVKSNLTQIAKLEDEIRKIDLANTMEYYSAAIKDAKDNANHLGQAVGVLNTAFEHGQISYGEMQARQAAMVADYRTKMADSITELDHLISQLPARSQEAAKMQLAMMRQDMQRTLEQTEGTAEYFSASIQKGIGQPMQAMFQGLITGTESVRSAFGKMLTAISNEIASFVASGIVKQLMGVLNQTGAFSGAGSFLSSIFGGKSDNPMAAAAAVTTAAATQLSAAATSLMTAAAALMSSAGGGAASSVASLLGSGDSASLVDEFIQGANSGGLIAGGGPDVDSVLARLTPGEHVTNRTATNFYGHEFMNAINSMMVPRSVARAFSSSPSPRNTGAGFNRGGHVGADAVPHMIVHAIVPPTAEHADRILRGGPDAIWSLMAENRTQARAALGI